ncbi:uncharacterized protein LOC123523472 [Mercenaria mercenaria]|uniref:uncharacterized protein LOC123523472 n=1 Tax=Mercenaria mercenaria TaxID=6596 RepID=UPI00234EDF28|nr:uncharacterized protein LOC123523472 [Mercenaria mercenaria]
MKCEKNMCGCTYCYESVDEKCEVSDKKVLVLGAGMAGIMAAKTLGESGCSNVQILEATNRTGGRIQSVNISGYMMELGAQWIYGLGSNPIAALADQYGFEIVEEFDTWVVRDKFGNNVTAKADNDWYHIVDVLEKVRRFSRKLHRDGEPDITAEALLRKFGWNPVDNVAEAVEVYQLDVENGRETPSVSGKYLNNLRVFEEHGSDDWMISSDPRGYSYIIDELVRSFRDGQRILFNKKVTSIENWDDENTLVEVYTEDGSRYEADDVIITFSLGVLQSRQVNFEPPLSGKKMMAIDKFGFGKYTQMYFQFSSAFWDNTSTIVYAGDRHGESSVWYNMNSVFPGSNILQLALSGFEAETAERMTDAEVIESSMTVLRSMYPAANISGPIMFKKPNWQFDTTTLGSHSYWTTGFTYEDMDYLGMPEGHLHFAGDYISQTNYGYVHTSYNSGKNTALDLAGSVNL